MTDASDVAPQQPVDTVSAETQPVSGDVSYYATMGDDGNVLELIRTDDSGVYLRDNAQWTLMDPSDDNPQVWGPEWVEVTDDFVADYDRLRSESDTINRDVVDTYAV